MVHSGNRTYTHNRQPEEQHTTKTLKQNECKSIEKPKRLTENMKQTFIKGNKGLPPRNSQRQNIGAKPDL